MKPPSNNLIAMVCLVMAVFMAGFVFQESRNDPGLRIAALVAATGAVSALLAIASTILTGKDLTKHDEGTTVSTASPTASVTVSPTDPTQNNQKGTQ